MKRVRPARDRSVAFLAFDPVFFFDEREEREGHPVGSGTYYYRLTAGSFAAVKKMTLIKL